MDTFVSVIIPVYNAGRYLDDCLGSIISSSVFDELEVILVDDGSKDGSGFICDRFSQKNENIITFHVENGGVSNARNFGVAKACGEYVTFCDADDYYVNGILSKAVASLRENKADLLFYDFVNEQQGNAVVRLPFEENAVLSKESVSELFKFVLKNEGFNSVWNKFFKKEILEQNDISFTPGQKHGEDRDFVLEFLSFCKTACYLPEAGYFYRYVRTSAVNKKRTDYFDNVYNEMKFKLKAASGFDVPFHEAERLIKETVVERIISSTFASSENGTKSFLEALEALYKNCELLGILREYKSMDFHNPAYKRVAALLCSKKTLRCRFYIRFLKLKEQIFKLIKG